MKDIKDVYLVRCHSQELVRSTPDGRWLHVIEFEKIAAITPLDGGPVLFNDCCPLCRMYLCLDSSNSAALTEAITRYASAPLDDIGDWTGLIFLADWAEDGTWRVHTDPLLTPEDAWELEDQFECQPVSGRRRRELAAQARALNSRC